MEIRPKVVITDDPQIDRIKKKVAAEKTVTALVYGQTEIMIDTLRILRDKIVEVFGLNNERVQIIVNYDEMGRFIPKVKLDHLNKSKFPDWQDTVKNEYMKSQRDVNFRLTSLRRFTEKHNFYSKIK